VLETPTAAPGLGLETVIALTKQLEAREKPDVTPLRVRRISTLVRHAPEGQGED
jgi:hypothetical protein